MADLEFHLVILDINMMNVITITGLIGSLCSGIHCAFIALILGYV